jgi:2-oxoglutarate/2-oxoacid ferredoxin oxidoreductase subunit alpha
MKKTNDYRQTTNFVILILMQYTWKIGGEAGVGIMTIGVSFAKLATRAGKKAFAYSEYPSLIRGGQNTYEITISDIEVTAGKATIDMLVCLNKATYEIDKNRLTKQSIVVYDPDDFETPITEFTSVAVPFSRIAKSLKMHAFAKNTTALSVSNTLLGGNVESIFTLLQEEFSHKKGSAIVDQNKQLALAGKEVITSSYNNLITNILDSQGRVQQLVVTGNEAFSLAAIASDLRFYSAYPMTPSSSILGILAGFAKETGMVVRHAEDEIAVIAEALGASFTGVRSSVGTSGGGFALMVEHISFAGVAELPIVIYLGMRPGPATGMPTWTEQADLLFAAFSGHGEFPKIVLAPGDALEMVELTREAFNLADIYQTPVIIVADKYLCESNYTVLQKDFDQALTDNPIDRGEIIESISPLEGGQGDVKYMRYALTENGISPLLHPGYEGQYWQANSYSHNEDSHTTEDGEERKAQVDKLLRKEQTYLKNHCKAPKYYGVPDAEVVLVSCGATKSIAKMAVDEMNANGKSVGLLHFTHIFPLDANATQLHFKESARYILVENNATAQFGKLLRMQTGVDITEKYLRYDGRPFTIEEITNYIRNL